MKKIALTDGPLAPAFKKLVGSLAGPNPAVNTPDEAGRVAGFWLGLWHGTIAPVTFIISLFSDKVHVYDVHNNGKWYLFGFLLGVTALRGGGGRANSPRRPKSS
jgi:hypothetical protein